MNIKEKLQGLIKNGFLYILSGNILNRAIAMISAILVAALVNKQEYAYLGYADNLYGYLSYTMGLGLSSALLKYCSVAESKSVERAYFRFSVSVCSVFVKRKRLDKSQVFSLLFHYASHIIQKV